MRDRILDAARRHFASLGYAGTSLDRVANEAAVTKPMVHYYFASKEGLFGAVFTAELTSLAARLHTALQPRAGLAADLLALVRAATDGTTTRFLSLARAESAPATAVDEVQRLLVEVVAEVLERARARGETVTADAATVAAALFGGAAVLGDDPAGLQRLVSLLVDGVRAPAWQP